MMRDPQALNITEGFGEALTTALDVMGLNLPNNITPVENNVVSPQVIHNILLKNISKLISN